MSDHRVFIKMQRLQRCWLDNLCSRRPGRLMNARLFHAAIGQAFLEVAAQGASKRSRTATISGTEMQNADQSRADRYCRCGRQEVSVVFGAVVVESVQNAGDRLHPQGAFGGVGRNLGFVRGQEIQAEFDFRKRFSTREKRDACRNPAT